MLQAKMQRLQQRQEALLAEREAERAEREAEWERMQDLEAQTQGLLVFVQQLGGAARLADPSTTACTTTTTSTTSSRVHPGEYEHNCFTFCANA
jgi:hypothetical protein